MTRYRGVVRIIHVCAGLWNRYFLVIFKGEKVPAVPAKPPLMHMKDKVQVPYTTAERATRKAAYKVRKARYNQTMKVILSCEHNNAF
jgi:hypothetical protein